MNFICFDDFKDYGEKLVIVRDGIILSEVYGVKKTEQNTKFFDFYPGTGIKPGDWIQQTNTGEKYYVYLTDTDAVNGDAYAVKGYYWLEKEYKTNQALCKSAIDTCITSGTYKPTANCEMCNSNEGQYDLDSLKSCIEKNGNKDREILKELIETIRMITTNNVSVQKGTLNRYKDVLYEHKWLNQPISQMLVAWLTGN